MKNRYHYVALLVVGLCHPAPVQGFSTGAGACPGAVAAVSGLHRSATDVSERMLSGSFTVMAGDTALKAGAAVDLPIGKALTLTVKSVSEPFKGVLIRLEAPSGVDTEGAIASGTNTKDASVCVAPVVGLTHNINSMKMTASGVLRFDSPVVGVQLDVTVVKENSAEASTFFYSRYTVNFRDDSAGGIGSAPSPNVVLPLAWPPALRPSQAYHKKPKGGKKKDHKDSKKKQKGRKGGKKSKHSTSNTVSRRGNRQSSIINALSLFRKHNNN